MNDTTCSTTAFSRLSALMLKELRQIMRDKRLVFLLFFPPTIQLAIYGLALNPVVTDLPLVVVDEARSTASRELIDKMTESHAFKLVKATTNDREADALLGKGRAVLEMNIPPSFQRELDAGHAPTVQLIVNAADAFSSGLASSYAKQAITTFRPRDSVRHPLIRPAITFVYNPGLVSSWFFTTGMLGMVLMMTSSMLAAGVVGREKDSGTLEQLLMTPASTSEILTAKIVPLFFLLFIDVLLGVLCARLIFGIPFNGSFLLFLACAGLYLIVGIGIGVLLATVSKNQQQAQLLSFFVNLPIIQLSGSVAPFESMPPLCQKISWFNPLRHFTEIVRAIVLRGAGVDAIWPHMIMLAAIAVVIFAVSITLFRKRVIS